MPNKQNRIIDVTRAEWLSELLLAMWREMGIEDIEDNDISR